MRPLYKREQPVGRRGSDGSDDPNGQELQCLDCYAIFDADGPPGQTPCESCGSHDTAVW